MLTRGETPPWTRFSGLTVRTLTPTRTALFALSHLPVVLSPSSILAHKPNQRTHRTSAMEHVGRVTDALKSFRVCLLVLYRPNLGLSAQKLCSFLLFIWMWLAIGNPPERPPPTARILRPSSSLPASGP